MWQRIEKKKEYAAAKNVQYSKWESIKKSPIPTLLLATSSVAPKTVMPNVDMVQARRSVEKKIYPQVVNILKESIGVTTITNQILDLGISLTVDKLLMFALAIEK